MSVYRGGSGPVYPVSKNKRFSAKIRSHGKQTIAGMLAVAKESIQDVIEDAQLPVAKGGRMRVDTGFLRNSMASGLNGSLGGASDSADPDGNASRISYELAIANMDIGDVAQFAWTADYAYVREVGGEDEGNGFFSGGDHFLGGAAAKWSVYVQANAARLKI